MQLDELKERLKAAKMKLAQVDTEIKDNREKANEFQQESAEKEKAANLARGRALQTMQVIATLERDRGGLSKDILNIQETIKREEFETEVREFTDKQKDFWDVVQVRMEKAQEEANANLVGFEITVKAEDVINDIKTLLNDSHHFSEFDVFVRNTMGEYSKGIREVGKIVARGDRVALQQKLAPQGIIDKFLQNPMMETRWNK